MVNRRLVEELSLKQEKLEEQVQKILSKVKQEQVNKIYEESMKEFSVDSIMKGRIVRVVGDSVLVDIGYKSEGAVPKADFTNVDDIRLNEDIEVYLESIEDETGCVSLSKQKADKIRGWERIIKCNREGDSMRGMVIKKVKGGLLVDVGVPVFLPASQVDIYKIDDIGELIGKEIEVKIVKIDEKRMNVIVSRKRHLEEQREELKKKVIIDLKEGSVIKAQVKNFSDYGAFVDIGGTDALLHLSDISWVRISHPTEVLRIGQQIEVKILRIDREEARVAVGLKQLQKNPWEQVASKYQIGMKVKGRVVNVVPYGVFISLEPGIEGLMHISEMSWTKPPSHPGDLVKVGDEITVSVVSINVDKQEIGLSMRQAIENPWEIAAVKYQPGTKVKGRVRNLISYGAFIELPEGIEGLLHIKDMSWTKKVAHSSELLKMDQEVELFVVSMNKDRRKLVLSLKHLQENPWEKRILEKYKLDTTVQGRVTKIVSFGAFVELEKDLEGLIHASKMGKKDIALAVGDIVECKVEKIDPVEGKIGLIFMQVLQKTPSETR